VVIGGGVVGVSTLYHLVRKGWTNSVLIERKALTSGSTWHAAGLLPLFNMSYSVGQLHKYSLALYRTLEAETGQDPGFREVGNIRLATCRERMDEYYQYAGLASTLGVRVEVLTPGEVLDLWPLAVTDGLVGAIRHPEDGYIQPAGVTQALAAGARAGGGEVVLGCPVVGIRATASGEWYVETAQGTIRCEHVVSATGSFARRTGAMVGLEVPVVPVEHQYLVTEPHPSLQARRTEGCPELGVLRESYGSWYMREEAGGLLLGPYEVGAPACYRDGPDPESEYELFPADLDRLAAHVESAIRRVPAFGELGIKQTYNGAIPYTPDGSPLVGPAPGLRNFWLNEGHSFGVTAAGGAGWQLAEWMVEGEPGIDMLGVDPRRFGPYATRPYLVLKNEEAYASVFTIHFPDEERPAGRPLRQAPCYDRMKARGAVFGQKAGWERPNWFGPEGTAAEDDGSFRRSGWFETVGEECRHVAGALGVADLTPFAKARVHGPGAAAFLDRMLANRLPSRPGRVVLAHALAPSGGVHSEFTVLREGPDSFYLVSAGAWQALDHDWLRRGLPADRSVVFEDVTSGIGVLLVSGPRARELLARVSEADLSSPSFPWLSARTAAVGLAPVTLIRVSYVGELGWEIHHPIEYQNHVFDALWEAGRDLELRPFGVRAMDSLRIEKSYRVIGTELSIEYSALESALERFVAFDKGEFVGRDSLLRQRDAGLPGRLVTVEVTGFSDADPLGNNPLSVGAEVVGRTTSGNYGFRLGRSLALAMVPPEVAREGQVCEIEVLGERGTATVVRESPYDPENERLRA